ncbi:MAPEG family protein [Pseudomonas putida]|uniref:MAPEG family protein n=1 Tax=Pseudomonas putida TaxID=303 RepID=A0A7W2QGX9_PSEPU|nr:MULTISPECIES: MAPEG family protein [Pseudomonas]MBA6114223.1 MAPEG family protein [Pseudomonas putida]MBI6940833.1 MAPEG family protein [Pseudomonas putida]MBI6957031.1 MAPEG family protein [Pseudomonas putida]MCZ9640007.1 MAPEG family protein [Pseudomonas putida]MEC4875433.1 MAPEG family protein [Pseudomonas sp. NC26]
MTVALWCILIALVLPPLCALIAKVSSGRFGLKDNHDPRAFLDTLSGLPRRAHAAQQNSYEAFPAFAAAVLVADIVGNAEQVTQDVLGVLYITSRLLYIICYLADWAALRSVVWFAGLALIVSFFVVSI